MSTRRGLCVFKAAVQIRPSQNYRLAPSYSFVTSVFTVSLVDWVEFATYKYEFDIILNHHAFFVFWEWENKSTHAWAFTDIKDKKRVSSSKLNFC